MNKTILLEQAKDSLDQGNYENAIALLEQCIEIDGENVNYYWYLGLIYLLSNEDQKAQDTWLLFLGNKNEEEYTERIKSSLVYFLEKICLEFVEKQYLDRVRKILNAIFMLKENYQSIELDKNISYALENLYKIGIQAAQNKEYQRAEISFYKILDFLDDPQTWYNLAILYYELQQTIKAESAINNAIELDSNKADYFYVFGLILEQNNDLQGAILNYEKAININKFYADAYNNLGNLYQKNNFKIEALSTLEKSLYFCPNHPGAYINLGNFYLQNKDYKKAESIYQLALNNDIFQVEIYDGFTQTLNELGKIKESLALLEEAISCFPDNLVLMRKKELFLPAIYSNQEEIFYYRERFIKGLEALSQAINLSLSDNIQKAYEIIDGQNKTGQTNFYLAYQNFNDCDLQKKYGQIIHRIMGSAYPQWVKPLRHKPVDNRKLKIGYISQRMQSLLARLLIGWIENRNTEIFETYCYNIGEEIDSNDQYFQILSDHYYHFSNQLEATCKKIRDDELDILVYFEIGMDPLISQLANLRLAPIKCATWGHPMTTGFPTIDYFLGSDEMEPENAQDHYSERLVRLPKLGFNVALPPYLEATVERQYFDLNKEDIIYLSCQYLPKYLPQHDYIFPEISKCVPNAKFVFIKRSGSETITEIFKQRLDRIFSEYNLDYTSFCSFLPGLKHSDYLNVVSLSDIFLDTIGFSGGFTSLDAIACGLPIVTLPTELMRGRQSYGMLNIIGVSETIAENEKEYIDIAVKLGKDKIFQETIRKNIIARRNLLFDDKSCIVALEDFYQSVIKSDILSS